MEGLPGGQAFLPERSGGTRFDMNRLAPTGRDACPPGMGGNLRPHRETGDSLRLNAMAPLWPSRAKRMWNLSLNEEMNEFQAGDGDVHIGLRVLGPLRYHLLRRGVQIRFKT